MIDKKDWSGLVRFDLSHFHRFFQVIRTYQVVAVLLRMYKETSYRDAVYTCIIIKSTLPHDLEF